MHHCVRVSCIWKRVKGMTEKWITALQRKDGKFRPALWGGNKNSCSTSQKQYPNHKMKTELLFMFRHEKSGRVQTFAPCFCKTIPCTAGLVAWAAGERPPSKQTSDQNSCKWLRPLMRLINKACVGEEQMKVLSQKKVKLTRKSLVWLLLLPHLIMAAKSCSQ